MSKAFVSGIYKGRVGHRRLSPKKHNFDYAYSMFLLDPDELNDIDNEFRLIGKSRFKPIRLCLSDHLSGVNDPIEFKRRIKEKVNGLGGSWQGDKLLMMTQARFMGIYFSPVNFFFCYQNKECRYMLAEVSNTPWHEKHWYLVDLHQSKPEVDKEFHVSPFMPLEQKYRWKIHLPDERFMAHIENWQQQKTFDATLRLKREELSSRNVTKHLMRFPILTVSTVLAIYWQAMKMFIKGFQFYPYSKSRG